MTNDAPPKAGIAIAGHRIESHALYRLKARADPPRARLQLLRRTFPPTLAIKVLTRLTTPETRRRWQDRGLLRGLDRILAGGRMRIAYGIAEGMRLPTEHVDVAGAQAYHVVRGTHELTVQEALRRTLPRGGVCYDVGANIGLISLVAARLAGPEGQVVSLDPEPANVAALEAAAALNGLENVVVVHAAATAQSGPVEVIGVRDTLWTRIAAVGEHPLERERMQVEGIALDDLIEREGIRAPDVVKIDVEGAELIVLDGMTRLLEEVRPIIVLEMHGKNQAVAELLGNAGYALENLDSPEPLTEAGDNVHVLARPA